MLAEIEGSQSPNRQGAGPLAIQEVMAYYQVPALSIAVIQDFAVCGAKSWGVADVETGALATNGAAQAILQTQRGNRHPGGFCLDVPHVALAH